MALYSLMTRFFRRSRTYCQTARFYSSIRFRGGSNQLFQRTQKTAPLKSAVRCQAIMKVYLIGLNHNVQYVYESRPYTLSSFKEYLETTIDRYSISLIAEESSIEAIEREKASDSIAHVIAVSKGIEHRLADPDSQIRESLGIPSERMVRQELGLGRALSSEELHRLDQAKAKYHHIREKYWLSQITDHDGNILFLCGDSHIEGFFSLLKNNNHQTEILSKNWNATSNMQPERTR